MILEQLGVCMEKHGLSWWPSSHICLWELNCEKGRTPKNLCLWTVVQEKTPESLSAERSNQSILRDISPEYSLEGLVLNLKLQDFGHLMRTADLLEKSLMLGKVEGRRKRGCQRMRWLDGITRQWTWTWANFRRRWGAGRSGVL